MPSNSLATARQRLERQLHYLRSPLPPGPDVCATCRGPKHPVEHVCSRCAEHRRVAGASRLADTVVMISYAFRSHPELSQHSWTLWNYKKQVAHSPELILRLNDLFRVFINAHARCIGTSLGGPPDWYTIVPSSEGRTAHPLVDVTRIESVRQLAPIVNPAYSAKDRRFQPDAFRPFSQGLAGAKVLVIDDAWVTGNTAQSLACRLKCDGAAAVVIVTLGRWADWRDPPWKRIIERSIASTAAFDVDVCSLCCDSA